MKTNAPEKIYLCTDENGVRYFTEGIPFERKHIEYTCTDAFIEKACDAYCRLCDTKECGDTGEPRTLNPCALIELRQQPHRLSYPRCGC